jgi:hypothetical protein
MSVSRIMNRLRNRSDADEPWRRNFLERLADLDDTAQQPSPGAVPQHPAQQHPAYGAYQTAPQPAVPYPASAYQNSVYVAGQHARIHAPSATQVRQTADTVLYGFADALKHLDAAQQPTQRPTPHAHAAAAAASNRPAPIVTSVVAIPEDCLAYWDSIDQDRELVELAKTVQKRARRSIQRGIMVVAVSTIGLVGLITGAVWLQLTYGTAPSETLMSSLQEPEPGARQAPMQASMMMTAKSAAAAPPTGPRRDAVTLASTGPRASTAVPSRYADLTSAVFEEAPVVRRPAHAPAPVPAAGLPAAGEVRIESPALAQVDAEGQVAVPLTVTSVADIPADAYVLIEALPQGLVPAVGLHVANGVWKLEPDELDSFALVVGASAPEFFAFTVSVFASDSTALGRSTAAVALRYTKRRMVTTAATSVVRTDSEAQRDAKLVAPKPTPPVSPTTIVARVEKPAAAKPVPAKVAAIASPRVLSKPAPEIKSVVENEDDEEQAAAPAKVSPRLQPHFGAGVKPPHPPQPTESKAARPQPNVDNQMGVGVRMVPPKPMASVPVAVTPRPRLPGLDTDWKKEFRDNSGTRQ